MIGVKSVQGPLPRIDEVLRLIMEDHGNIDLLKAADMIAHWNIVRVGMWWELDGNFVSPLLDQVALTLND